jgi:hypothetical protein
MSKDIPVETFHIDLSRSLDKCLFDDAMPLELVLSLRHQAERETPRLPPNSLATNTRPDQPPTPRLYTYSIRTFSYSYTCTGSLGARYSCDHGYGSHRIPSNVGMSAQCYHAAQRSQPLRETYRNTVAHIANASVGQSTAGPGGRRVKRSCSTGGKTEHRNRRLVTGTYGASQPLG